MKRFKDRFYFKIHYSFIVLFIISLVSGRAILYLEYFLSLVLHELVHLLVARRRGYQMGRIKLMATGAVLEAESDEFSFSDEIIIAAAGPLFNLFVGLTVMALWWVEPESYNFTQDLCVINLAIFGFNILPIFPLDGGRILLAFMSKRLDRSTAVKISRAITMALSILIFFLFIASMFIAVNFSLGIMAVTLFISAISEDKMAVYRRALMLERKRMKTKKNGLEVRTLFVDSRLSDIELFRLLSPRYYTIFIMVDQDFKIMSRLDEALLISRLSKG